MCLLVALLYVLARAIAVIFNFWAMWVIFMLIALAGGF